MPYRLLFASIAVLALVFAPQAAAKGIDRATVCGVDACTSGDRDDLGPALMDLMGGTPTMPPTEAAPWYRAELEMGDGRPGGRVFDTFTINVLPQSGYIRMRDGYGGWSWSEMTSAQQAVYLRLTRGIEPFPATELTGIAEPEPTQATAASPGPGAQNDAGGGSRALPWVILGAAVAALVAAWMLQRTRRRSAIPSAPHQP